MMCGEAAMGRVEVFVHLMWSTWRRRPLILSDVEPVIAGIIQKRCVQLRCSAIAVGGTEDHVHLLAKLHPAVSVALLAKEVKGFSSFLMTHEVTRERFFRWQDGYLAVSVGPDDVPVTERYVREQKIHHATGELLPDLEAS
jgi:putative transposase